MYPNHVQFSQVVDAQFPYPASDPYNAIDSRHRHFLYEIIMAGKFTRILEVGTWIGYSTAAIVKAMLDGATCEVHLCDWKFQPSIHQLAKVLPDRIHLHEQASLQVINSDYDFIFVDGDHTWINLAMEIHLLLKHRVKNVLFHDTNSGQLGYQGCEGPWLAKMILTQLPERYSSWYLDEQSRPPERTDRGLLFCSNLPQDLVVPIWQNCMR